MKICTFVIIGTSNALLHTLYFNIFFSTSHKTWDHYIKLVAMHMCNMMSHAFVMLAHALQLYTRGMANADFCSLVISVPLSWLLVLYVAAKYIHCL